MTYKHLLNVMQTISLNLGERTTKEQKKLYKILEKLQHHLDDYQKLLEDVRLEFASVDTEGNVILNEKGEYKFNKDNFKQLRNAVLDLDKKEVEKFEVINIVNPSGLEKYTFLKDVVTGVEFEKVSDEDSDI